MIRSNIVMTEKVEKETFNNVVQHVRRNLDLCPPLLSLLLHQRLNPNVVKLEVNGMMAVVTTMKT
jgi:hypothetical protein